MAEMTAEQMIDGLTGKAQELLTGGSDRLPIRLNSDGKKAGEALLKKWGFELGERIDDLFREARLPADWQLLPTDHAMWSKVVDVDGNERISIFYYVFDCDAFMSIMPRYQNVFSSDGAPYENPDQHVIDGIPIFRGPIADKKRVSVFKPTDKKTGRVHAVFVGDHGEASDKSRDFMKVHFGEDCYDPARWDEP